MKTILRPKVNWLLWLLPLLFMAMFFYAPLFSVLRLMLGQLMADGLAAGLGRPNAGALLLRVTAFTLWQASLSTLLTLLLGLPAAFFFARRRFWGKRALHVILTLPFILPTVVAAAGFSALLGANGWVNQAWMAIFQLSRPPLMFSNSLAAILVAHVFYNCAIVIRVVGAAWSQLDPRVEQAARTLGASPLRTFFSVTLPLLRPSLLAAALLVFLFNFSSFGVVLLLGGPRFATLEVEIYTQALQMLNLPLAAVLSVIQLGSTLVLTWLYRLAGRTSAVPLLPRFSLRGDKPRGAAENLLAGAVLLTLTLLILLPLTALLMRSFFYTSREGSLLFTFDFYRELFTNRRGSLFFVPPIRAVGNSLRFGLLTMLISLALGMMIAYALERAHRLRGWFEGAVMLPLGTSPITLGLGFILLFNRPPLDVRSFPLLIPIAHSLVALPLVVRVIQPALASIPRSLRESAAVLGASPWRRWLEVDLPIISRAGVVAGVFAFTVSLGEFGATTFLSRPEMPTLPMAVFRFLAQPGGLNYGAAMAVSVLLLALCASAIALIESVQRRAG